jgi:heat-inducible transcriptional repressor
MRQLKPEVVEQRKKHLLQWIIHYYIKTSKPVSSAVIAEEAGLELSSASIRNILQELENEGFLVQPHTSSGREPTDKGYRFYVEHLVNIQRLASDEKASIDRQYTKRIEELDTLLKETSKLLSKVSHGAGLVLSPQLKQHAVKRLELIPLGGRSVLGILITEAGFVRHWPIRLAFVPSARQLTTLNRVLNEGLRGCTVKQAQAAVGQRLKELEREFQDLSALAGDFLKEIGEVIDAESLYIEGADNILNHADEFGDLKTVQSLMRLMGQREAIAGLLEHELDEQRPLGPQVRIGAESGMPELAGLSLVTRTYTHNDRVVGVLGILGSKRMEYSRMMSLVDYLGDVVSRQLQSWREEDQA